jgi:hypothetical protein
MNGALPGTICNLGVWNMEGIINLELIRTEMATLEREIKNIQERMAAQKEALDYRISRLNRLNDFLALANEFEAGGEVIRKKPGGPRRLSNRKLVRNPSKTQTRMANILLNGYEPGEIFTLSDGIEKLSEFIPPDIKIARGHWLASYLTREIHFSNGILEKTEEGDYRVRENARDMLRTSR